MLSGDGDYGPATDLPWAMAFPNGTVPTPERVHPTMIYESIAFVLVFLVLWSLRKKNGPAGWLFLLYLVLAGVVRFLMEFWRNTPEVMGGFTLAQLFSVGMILLGGIWLILLFARSRRNVL
ncbi:MAG: prolipoprotein diacylglyceryl transferase [bacterium]|nr:prolipoprotein diacylglyceryl transferase [bacterium]